MTEKVFCEKCGAEMIPIDPERPVGMTCPKCGWGWATTYIEPVLNDQKTYTITILTNDFLSIVTIKTISQLTGINYLQAKELIKTAPFLLTKDYARNLLKTIKTLDDNLIQYKIEPEFPYTLDGKLKAN